MVSAAVNYGETIFEQHDKNVCNGQCLVVQLTSCVKNVNVVIFLDSVTVMYIKLRDGCSY